MEELKKWRYFTFSKVFCSSFIQCRIAVRWD